MDTLLLIRCYVRNILVGVDQLLNALLLGDPDETLSSRLGKHRHGIARLICRLLSLVDARHCEKSIEPDEGGQAVFANKKKEEPDATAD